MASDLIIGRVESDEWEYLAGICKPRGIDLPAAYSGGSDDHVLISLFNIATVGFFNTYAATLEGLQEPEATTKSTFRNLPWWMEFYWLPLDFDPPIQERHMSVGSSIRLLDELERIKKMSAFDIAVLPPRYADMREDYTAWFNRPADPDEKPSDDNILRWMWNALREGARLSIAQNVPMMLAP